MWQQLALLFLTFPNSDTGSNSGSGTPFDLQAYMGRWYQIADIPQWYEKDCNECTQAMYRLQGTNNISVFNTAVNPQTQEVCKILGYAYAPQPSEPTQLLVVFPGVPIPAPYWIIQTGPIFNGQYSYAVVSNPSRTTLYILARSPTLPMYNQIVANLKSAGYPTEKLVLTPQTCANKEIST